MSYLPTMFPQPNLTDAELVITTRMRLDMTQAEFADRLGVHPRTVIRWEQGQHPLGRRGRIAVIQLGKYPHATARIT